MPTESERHCLPSFRPPSFHKLGLPALAALVVSMLAAAPAHAQEGEAADGEAVADERGAAGSAVRPPPSRSADGAFSPGRFSVGVPVEVNIIGLAYGVRPELLYRPFAADGGGHVRLAAGVLPGPEFVFIPLSLGWRHIFRRARKLQPGLGAGVEQQFYLISDADTVQRQLFYFEFGLEWRFMPRGHIGLQLSPGLALFSHPGAELNGRLTFRWDLR